MKTRSSGIEIWEGPIACTPPGQEMHGSRCEQYTWFQTPRFQTLCLSGAEVWGPKLEEADLRRLEMRSRGGKRTKKKFIEWT